MQCLIQRMQQWQDLVGGRFMKRTAAEVKRSTEEWLNERWFIANMEDARPQDMSYYNGALKAVEFLGYDWQRDVNGKHELCKR